MTVDIDAPGPIISGADFGERFYLPMDLANCSGERRLRVGLSRGSTELSVEKTWDRVDGGTGIVPKE